MREILAAQETMCSKRQTTLQAILQEYSPGHSGEAGPASSLLHRGETNCCDNATKPASTLNFLKNKSQFMNFVDKKVH